MNSMPDQLLNARINSSKLCGSSDVFVPTMTREDDNEAKQMMVLIEWMNSVVPNLNLPLKASSEELRACLVDGNVLIQILNRLRPGTIEGSGSDKSPSSYSKNVQKFLATMDELGIPRFEIADLEKGSMKTVMDCLLRLKKKFTSVEDQTGALSPTHRRLTPREVTSPQFGDDKHKASPESKLQRTNSRSPFMQDTPTALMHHVGHKFHEVFQLKQGRYADLSAAKISEMMKSNSLDNAPTQSLLSVVNGILDESIERKNGEIPHRVACLLRKVVQEIERRISTQAEHLRTQNNLFKSREEKYQSRIRVLEALASGTGEESETPKSTTDAMKKVEEEYMIKLMKEKEQANLELSTLKRDLDIAKKEYELEKSKRDQDRKLGSEDVIKLMKEKEQTDIELSILQRQLELETTKKDAENPLGSEEVIKLMKEKEQTEIELSKLKQQFELEMSKRDAEKTLGSEDMIKLMKEKEQMDIELSTLKRQFELEKSKRDTEMTLGSEDVTKLMKEKEQTDIELSRLKRDFDIAVKEYELEKSKRDEEMKLGSEDVSKLMKEKQQIDTELSALKQELEIAIRTHDSEKSQKDEEVRLLEEETIKLKKEKEEIDVSLAALKTEFKTLQETHELHCLKLESAAKNVQEDLERRMKDLERTLEDSRKKVKALEAYTESKNQMWNKKEVIFKSLVEVQSGTLKELKFSSASIKSDIMRVQESYSEDYASLGMKFKTLIQASENYHLVLAENRKMFNELQDLKGNIRVYCRIRPLIGGQAGKPTTIEHIGENGELVVANPSKPGKDNQRLFRFNKVYGPHSTQGEVFSDTQPLIRCVLDGFNVCIFAYGQTGSGKTYTMTGPNGATEENWGVNYRALNDLFHLSQNRSSSFQYTVGVQMFEIYNETLRDLLSKNDGSPKKLGIKTTTQANGLAVPDASMHAVTSTADVIELMEIGLGNRAVSATALNERSSRSHSVVSIHVQGKDLHTGTALQGNLHLVDLAGSERVDRSEVTGDRLREAQHINKSLSALGDVIFSLAQKSSHVPYRNSKLTQLLQASLGGQAKTLMFVQLNPDTNSYFETMSTLKFAERVSGVELGAAKSSKEGRDIRELMEQVATLKDTIAKKDGEIERLQLVKDIKSANPGNSEKQGKSLLKPASASELHLEGRLKRDVSAEDVETLGEGDGDRDDRLSDYMSDGGVSTGPDLDGSTDEKPADKPEKNKVASRIRSLQRLTQQPSATAPRNLTRAATSLKKPSSTATSTSTPVKSTGRPWQ
ncbi:Kinesin-like protein KIN-14C [Euphorbia peplus]|nr:Kinesin-like protein KIN-14C [Euphorbia peplus]